MKLKYTTKLFIVVNAIILVFRTLQILLLTESNTAFLKGNLIVINVIGTILVVLALAALFLNSFQAVRQPVKINCKGIPSMAAAALTGVLYLVSGIVSTVSGKYGSTLVLVMSILAALACALLAASAVTKIGFRKLAALPLIAYWLAEFVSAYLFYTERPLRVRTVYETLAVCFVILFSVTFGKAASGVKPEKSFRRLYPLGLTACSLCMASVVPELIATIFGFSEKVSDSAVMPLALAAAAVFTGFFTINTFKKSNTINPRKKRRAELEARMREQEENQRSEENYFPGL